MNSDWSVAEYAEKVDEYFRILGEITGKEGILPDDTWNMDETGFRISIGKTQLVVTKPYQVYYRVV